MTYFHLVNLDPVTNAADFSFDWQCEADDGGEIGLFTDNWAVTVTLYRLDSPSYRADYKFNFPPRTPLLTASTADGTLSVIAGDYVQWTWRAAQLRSLRAGAYLLSGVGTKDADTIQLFLANLPIFEVI